MSNNSTSLPKENGNGNINVADNTIFSPIVLPAESLTSAKTTVILVQETGSSKIYKAIS